mgnify:CR=1 FL=1
MQCGCLYYLTCWKRNLPHNIASNTAHCNNIHHAVPYSPSTNVPYREIAHCDIMRKSPLCRIVHATASTEYSPRRAALCGATSHNTAGNGRGSDPALRASLRATACKIFSFRSRRFFLSAHLKKYISRAAQRVRESENEHLHRPKNPNRNDSLRAISTGTTKM